MEERKQVNKSEQITLDGNIVVDYDQPLLKKDEILDAYKKILGLDCRLEKYGNHYIYTYTTTVGATSRNKMDKLYSKHNNRFLDRQESGLE